MKKTISLLTAMAIAGSMGATAVAANENGPMLIASGPSLVAEATMQVIANGKFVTNDTYKAGEGTMVPVRAVAEALGFTVTWNADRSIHLNNGDMQCDFAIGENHYTVYTAIPEAIGMSAPFALESAPEMKHTTTYVPVSLFVPLFGNDPAAVSVEGDTIRISPDASSDESAQIPSPLTDHATLAELEQTVAFPIKQPVLPEGYTVSSFSDIHKTLGQIIYQNGGQRIVYRISRDDGDISGDYTNYSNKCTVEMEGVSVQLRGEDAFHAALWRDQGFTHSVCASAGLTTEQIAQMVAATLG